MKLANMTTSPVMMIMNVLLTPAIVKRVVSTPLYLRIGAMISVLVQPNIVMKNKDVYMMK
jgi:hypothetical protein